MLRRTLDGKETDGFDIQGLREKLDAASESYEAMVGLAEEIEARPHRDDWPYVEPEELDGILAECDPGRPVGIVRAISADEAAGRVEAGFLASVCGCQLGKPVEVNPTLEELRAALEATGDWPLRDYFREATLEKLGRRHDSWIATTRENLICAAADDDINYTVLGMMVLERFGPSFTHKDLQGMWFRNLPAGYTYGPERKAIIHFAEHSFGDAGEPDYTRWKSLFDQSDPHCGACIRADAYGYACPGNPQLAAELAYRDAALTHRRNGIYGTMYIAAVIALAQVKEDRLGIFETALQFVPRRSRFYAIVSDSLQQVADATDWLDGYSRIHGKYRQYSHCCVFQEIGTLINTLRFAKDSGEGICMQVAQGNDTDSFGATAGSILGCYYGPGHLDARWLEPLRDTLHTSLAEFHDPSLSSVARRMGRLPATIGRSETS